MVSLGVLLVVSHIAAGFGHEHVYEGIETTAYIAPNGTDTAPLRCVMKLITDIYRQPSPEPYAGELMVEKTPAHIYIIRHPCMGQTAFDLEITEESREGAVLINADSHVRQGLTVSREDH